MKQNTETLVSIGVVAAAILISITLPNADTPETNQIAQTPVVTESLTLEEKQLRCQEDKALAFQTIRDSMALVETLVQNSPNDTATIDKHFQEISSAKARIENCQALVADYESKISTLENEIIALESEE